MLFPVNEIACYGCKIVALLNQRFVIQERDPANNAEQPQNDEYRFEDDIKKNDL